MLLNLLLNAIIGHVVRKFTSATIGPWYHLVCRSNSWKLLFRGSKHGEGVGRVERNELISDGTNIKGQISNPLGKCEKNSFFKFTDVVTLYFSSVSSQTCMQVPDITAFVKRNTLSHLTSWARLIMEWGRRNVEGPEAKEVFYKGGENK